MENKLNNDAAELDNPELAFPEDALSEADALASVGDPALSPSEAMSGEVGA